MPRGINKENFSSEFKDNNFWKKYNLDNKFTFIYVGRLSREKNIEFLLETFTLLERDQ